MVGLPKSGFVRPFHEDDDATGLWKTIKSNSRVCASWVQVLPKLRVLCFSFYGQASLADGSHLRINNFLLEQIFCVASQFGDIPVLIAGDFQCEPHCYEAFVNAKSYANWSDLLDGVDQHGHCVRPITFSQKCNFVDPTEGYSAIDGILVNRVACASLVDVAVDFASAKQHAPIVATFDWGKCFQTGFVLMPAAPFDLTQLPKNNSGIDDEKLSSIADHLWESKYSQKFQGNEDELWQTLNQFGIDILINGGAKFGHGLRSRGLQPKFQTKTPCPGQDFNGAAITTIGSQLVKVMQLVTELRHRYLRCATKAADFQITFALLPEKVIRLLQKYPQFKWWDPGCHLNSEALLSVQKQLHDLIAANRNKEKIDESKIGK